MLMHGYNNLKTSFFFTEYHVLESTGFSVYAFKVCTSEYHILVAHSECKLLLSSDSHAVIIQWELRYEIIVMLCNLQGHDFPRESPS